MDTDFHRFTRIVFYDSVTEIRYFHLIYWEKKIRWNP